MRTVRLVRATARIGGILAALGLNPGLAGAEVSAAKQLLCAVSQVMDCRHEDTCEREAPEGVNLPRFVRLDLAQKTLAAGDDAARTAPIRAVEQVDGFVMIQGGQGTRAWSMLVAESTGLMSGAVTEPEGSFVVSGACLNP
jgi:hypothetical protein